jgi:hypothetical protein
MSTTETKWPTAVELTDLLHSFTVSTGHGERHDIINFAYAVLAQWGNALPQISADGLRPSMDDVMGLAKVFGLEVNSPDALMWLVVTALASWGDAPVPAPAPEGEVLNAADLLPVEPPNIPTTMAMQYRSAWFEGVEVGWSEARAALARLSGACNVDASTGAASLPQVCR